VAAVAHPRIALPLAEPGEDAARRSRAGAVLIHASPITEALSTLP
jgi:hypothetical protein